MNAFANFRVVACFFFSICSIACRADSFTDKYSVESAKEVLAIGEIIRSGKEVGQKEWDRLFETDGYQKYAPVADLLIFNGHPTGYFESISKITTRMLQRRNVQQITAQQNAAMLLKPFARILKDKMVFATNMFVA